jgi:23S rRNA (pseudouridine1915-N3)-methyltransferase
MQIHVIAIGKRMPDWVTQGYLEYAKRLPSDFKLNLIEIAAEKRGKNANLNKIMQIESEKLLHACPHGSHIIAFDRAGTRQTTLDMAKKLGGFRDLGQDVSVLIGGPEGISEQIVKQANAVWSLSELTLPHPLVRVLLAEQFYRVFSILSSHPYHR